MAPSPAEVLERVQQVLGDASVHAQHAVKGFNLDAKTVAIILSCEHSVTNHQSIQLTLFSSISLSLDDPQNRAPIPPKTILPLAHAQCSGAVHFAQVSALHSLWRVPLDHESRGRHHPTQLGERIRRGRTRRRSLWHRTHDVPQPRRDAEDPRLRLGGVPQSKYFYTPPFFVKLCSAR